MDTLWALDLRDFFCCLCAQWWTTRPTAEEIAAWQKQAELCSIAARQRRDYEMQQQAAALSLKPGHINQIQFLQAIQDQRVNQTQLAFFEQMKALNLY